jgi:sugar phosphate isomerase/epimerase
LEKGQLNSICMFTCTRRQFVKLSLGTLPAASVILSNNRMLAAESAGVAAAKPDSKVAGVQLGLNVPYSFANPRMSGDEILTRCVRLGLSAVELRTQPVEVFLGAAADLVYAKKPAAGAEPTAATRTLADWRKSVVLDRVAPFRKQYEDAGVLIQIVKVDGIFQMSDDELDYVFGLAKALGGRAISTEISHRDEDLQRLGQFADKHQLLVGYHGHAATRPEDWERAFSFAKHNGANVDLGHFVAGNNTSPVAFIQQYQDRVTHVHVKDRKMHNGPNMPFGQGDTPIAEVLHLIRDHHWNIQATIEFEYKVPPGSDRMAEIARAIRYCRDVLA